MKHLALAFLIAGGFLRPSPSVAQMLGVFADISCQSCNIHLQPFAPMDFYIGFVTGGAVSGITGASFKIDGMPPGHFLTVFPVDPIIDWCWIECDPFQDPGITFAMPFCRTGPCVPLLRVSVFPTGTIASNTVLTVTARNPPLYPEFDCPMVTLCDSPVYTRMCVAGGQATINPTSNVDCTIAVQSPSWTALKQLFQ